VSKLYGQAAQLKVENGPELLSRALAEWAHRRGIKRDLRRPGKPTDNADRESFNGRVGEECLAPNRFTAGPAAQPLIEHWRVAYNNYRPDSALGNLTPTAFMEQWLLNSDRLKQISSLSFWSSY
jgi:putative transposase